MSSLINLKNINVIKNKVQILSNINLKIQKNDFITVIGPNGAGKSMLLKCLMGFYSPSSGEIQRQDNLKIGYMPQKFISNNMIPLDVKYFLSIGKKTSKTMLDKIIEQTSISSLLDKSLHILSGGQLQRVLMARALLGEPNLLILDEPAQNLDISGQISFYKLLDKIYKQNDISVIMVSHDLHFVMASSAKVICLFKHICCSGVPQHISKDPAFLELFGDDMSVLKSYNHSITHTTHTHEH